MTMVTVSVIITFYNQEKYVDSTMRSVMNQKTNFDFEIIAGDDGSTDGTYGEIKKWIDKYPDRISYYNRSRDDGVTVTGFRASRNRLDLLTHVKGKYFIFLDGDDYFSDDNKLQKQVDILEKDENSDCAACSHYIEALYPDGHKLTLPVYKLKEGKYDLKSYWAKLYFHTDTTLVRSSVIEKLPADYVINNFNDNLITFLILLQGKIYFLPEKMAIYLQTGDGIWTSKKMIVNHIRNMFMYDMCLELDPESKGLSQVRNAKSWRYLYKHRREIKRDELEPFRKEAEDRNLICSALFLNYKTLRPASKIRLTRRYAGVLLRFVIHKLTGR